VTDRKVVFSGKSVGKMLSQHLDEPVKSGERTLILRRKQQEKGKDASWYRVVYGFGGFVLAPPISRIGVFPTGEIENLACASE
jgi:hypothetical protein